MHTRSCASAYLVRVPNLRRFHRVRRFGGEAALSRVRREHRDSLGFASPHAPINRYLLIDKSLVTGREGSGVEVRQAPQERAEVVRMGPPVVNLVY